MFLTLVVALVGTMRGRSRPASKGYLVIQWLPCPGFLSFDNKLRTLSLLIIALVCKVVIHLRTCLVLLGLRLRLVHHHGIIQQDLVCLYVDRVAGVGSVLRTPVNWNQPHVIVMTELLRISSGLVLPRAGLLYA